MISLSSLKTTYHSLVDGIELRKNKFIRAAQPFSSWGKIAIGTGLISLAGYKAHQIFQEGKNTREKARPLNFPPTKEINNPTAEKTQENPKQDITIHKVQGASITELAGSHATVLAITLVGVAIILGIAYFRKASSKGKSPLIVEPLPPVARTSSGKPTNSQLFTPPSSPATLSQEPDLAVKPSSTQVVSQSSIPPNFSCAFNGKEHSFVIGDDLSLSAYKDHISYLMGENPLVTTSAGQPIKISPGDILIPLVISENEYRIEGFLPLSFLNSYDSNDELAFKNNGREIKFKITEELLAQIKLEETEHYPLGFARPTFEVQKAKKKTKETLSKQYIENALVKKKEERTQFVKSCQNEEKLKLLEKKPRYEVVYSSAEKMTGIEDRKLSRYQLFTQEELAEQVKFKLVSSFLEDSTLKSRIEAETLEANSVGIPIFWHFSDTQDKSHIAALLKLLFLDTPPEVKLTFAQNQFCESQEGLLQEFRERLITLSSLKHVSKFYLIDSDDNCDRCQPKEQGWLIYYNQHVSKTLLLFAKTYLVLWQDDGLEDTILVKKFTNNDFSPEVAKESLMKKMQVDATDLLFIPNKDHSDAVFQFEKQEDFANFSPKKAGSNTPLLGQ